MSKKIPAENLVEALPEEIAEIDLYQKREKIYTRKIEGFFQRIRLFTGWPLLIAYFFLPWMDWEGRQAVFFDLGNRKFYIFDLIFWPQDFSLLAWLLIISAFGLFLATKLFGRVWCGYTCPQTVWTTMFMWIEQRVEGTRNQRIKLDQAPWSANKLLRKSLKHAMWLGLAFYTSFTFIAYFTPANELIYSFFSLSASLGALVWIAIFTCLTYINAGWLREQVCLYMCPYARFQSVMFDANTLIVSYDVGRGEPRGSRKKSLNPKEAGLGDCVDCELCVQVCPTGIDIRNGLQYECIGCALCIDACNSIMEKMEYPKGLIRYTTENELAGEPSKSLFVRFDTLGYSFAITIMIALFAYTLLTRVPVKLDIIKDRGSLYLVNDDGSVENSYTARIMNMTDSTQTFKLVLREEVSDAKIVGERQVEVAPGELTELPFRIKLEKRRSGTSVVSLDVHLNSVDQPNLNAAAETRFLQPTE